MDPKLYEIVRTAVSEGVSRSALFVTLLTLALSILGAYLIAYTKRKAENLATKEEAASLVVWKKRNGAFFRLVECTTNRPPWQAATGGTRHGQRYQEAGRHA